MNPGLYSPHGFEPTLSKRFFVPEGYRLQSYRQDHGYEGLKHVLTLPPEAVIDTVKRSGLRGRGGAGFSAGTKWGFVPKTSTAPKYVVVNGDESEPGTYKDRYLLARDPHAAIEGAIIAAYAIGAHQIYFYLRGEFGLPFRRLTKAIEEAYAAGILGNTCLEKPYEIQALVRRGAGAYICGEETALLESLEGKIGRPRLKPPFPAVKGAFQGPTVVNNVETLACVPLIFTRGVDWFLAQGTPSNGGPKLVCLSGHIERPGIYEIPHGYPCHELLKLAGGVWKGRTLKALIPGGSSTPILLPKPCPNLADKTKPECACPLETETPLDFDSVAKAGSMFGSAGMMVLDDQTCMVRTLAILANFYAAESCGQCTPCREGTEWSAKILWRIEQGQATFEDLNTLESITRSMLGTTICPLADAFAVPAQSYLTKCQDEFKEHIERKGCWFPPFEVSPAGNTFWEDQPS